MLLTTWWMSVQYSLSFSLCFGLHQGKDSSSLPLTMYTSKVLTLVMVCFRASLIKTEMWAVRLNQNSITEDHETKAMSWKDAKTPHWGDRTCRVLWLFYEQLNNYITIRLGQCPKFNTMILSCRNIAIDYIIVRGKKRKFVALPFFVVTCQRQSRHVAHMNPRHFLQNKVLHVFVLQRCVYAYVMPVDL